MADSVALKLEVEINGECYALDKIPSENSGAVKEETKKLLGAIDLRALVSDLGRVGGFIRVAYNAVGAAGHQLTNEQIEIQRLGYDITKLCDKSALTVAKFKKASSSILTDLQCTYGYLLDNLEEMAIDTLSSVSKLAGEMEKAALELHHDFVAEEKKVIAALENTQQAKKIQADKVEEEKQRRIKLQEDIKIEEQLFEEHQKQEREAEARRRDLEQQEDQAISEIGEISVKSVVNGVTSMIGIHLYDEEGPVKKATLLRQNRLDALEAENAIRKKRQEALANMSAFTAKLRQCTNDQDMAECAVGALHEAVGALKHLSAVMMRAALFWKQMQDHCRSLAESEMQSQVEIAMQKYSEEKRLKVWTSRGFKQKAIMFYSGWVALNSVCGVYMEQIKETQRDLYKYITENPSYEESKKILPELAKKFMADLNRDQQAIEEKNSKAQEEIQTLTQAERR